MRTRTLIRTLGLALVALLAAGAASVAMAQTVYQRVPFASTPNPVGSGGRAIGWGSAFIAISDDATAASWNPGGLVQLVRPEASIVLSYHTRLEEFDFKGLSSDTDSRASDIGAINYASVVYPFNLFERNQVVSLNYQRLYEFDREFDLTASGVNFLGDTFRETRSLEQKGALTTVTPAYAIQILPQWSMGVAVNFWGLEDSGNGWEQQWQVEGVRDPGTINEVQVWSEQKETYEVTGTNFVIGTHIKLTNFTIGMVYKSEWEADVDFEADSEVANYYPFQPVQNDFSTFSFEKDEKIVWPASFGIGLAYRYSDRLSFAVDGYMTQWSRYKLKTDDGDLNLLSGEDDSGDIEDTWQVRAGAEYLWILPKYVFALRGGVFYDPEQVQEETNEFYGVAIGGGMVYQNFVIDAAIQAKFAQDVTMERIEEVQPEADVQDYLGIVSLIYHF